jgi:hypothetical protein
LNLFHTQNRIYETFGTEHPGSYYERRPVASVGELKHKRLPDYMEILKLDEDERRKRLAFFEITEEDFKRLTTLKSFAEGCTHEITEGLYELIMSQPESRAFFPDQATRATTTLTTSVIVSVSATPTSGSECLPSFTLALTADI